VPGGKIDANECSPFTLNIKMNIEIYVFRYFKVRGKQHYLLKIKKISIFNLELKQAYCLNSTVSNCISYIYDHRP